tara:strand:+ start:2402 stop:2863 length:462 start_codon:yes stop_codon:yes gene_type:complete
MKIKLLILFTIVSLSSFAQEEAGQGDVIQAKIKALEDMKPETFSQNVESLRALLDRYFDNKKRVCNGEYSTMVLGDVGELGNKAAEEGRKLSKDERKVCFREMKNLQVNYINALYSARRKYVLWLQEKQLEELTKVKDEAIKRLQTNFARYLD